jgi:transcriptional regulator with XRE-family HTH domain
MRVDSGRCGLSGIEDCAEVASASAASVIALATPRVPTAVSIAVEFGKAGHGWAGAIVFNLWLRRQLRERRMSQRQLAHLSGVNHSTISRLLAGDRIPSLETATKLARALRVPNEDIATELGFVTAQPALPMQRVEAALRGDEGLDDTDVRELMEAYIARRRRLSLKSVDSATAVVGSRRNSGPDPPA